MDVLPMCSIFQELQIVHDTGYFSALPSLEEYWQQVNISSINSFEALVCQSGTEHVSRYLLSNRFHRTVQRATVKAAVITVVNTHMSGA